MNTIQTTTIPALNLLSSKKAAQPTEITTPAENISTGLVSADRYISPQALSFMAKLKVQPKLSIEDVEDILKENPKYEKLRPNELRACAILSGIKPDIIFERFFAKHSEYNQKINECSSMDQVVSAVSDCLNYEIMNMFKQNYKDQNNHFIYTLPVLINFLNSQDDSDSPGIKLLLDAAEQSLNFILDRNSDHILAKKGNLVFTIKTGSTQDAAKKFTDRILKDIKVLYNPETADKIEQILDAIPISIETVEKRNMEETIALQNAMVKSFKEWL